jgi:hypothetical protein
MSMDGINQHLWTDVIGQTALMDGILMDVINGRQWKALMDSINGWH